MVGKTSTAVFYQQTPLVPWSKALLTREWCFPSWPHQQREGNREPSPGGNRHQQGLIGNHPAEVYCQSGPQIQATRARVALETPVRTLQLSVLLHTVPGCHKSYNSSPKMSWCVVNVWLAFSPSQPLNEKQMCTASLFIFMLRHVKINSSIRNVFPLGKPRFLCFFTPQVCQE